MTERTRHSGLIFFLILVLTSILKALGLQHYKNVSEKDGNVLFLFILNMFYKDINYIVTASSSKLVLN